jgi:hypothetical protein
MKDEKYENFQESYKLLKVPILKNKIMVELFFTIVAATIIYGLLKLPR